MSYLGDYVLADIVDFTFTTVNTSGAPTQLAGTPAISVYKTNSTTQSTSGVTLTVDFDAVTGLNHVRVDTSSDGTFYATGCDFHVVITAGTVSGTSVVGYTVGAFSLEKRTSGKIMSEPSATFAWATATPRNILAWLGALNRNKVTQTNTTKTLRNDADSGNISTAAVSDDGTTATRAEWS